MSVKLFLYDTETTHLSPNRGCIHQLAAMVVIDDEIKETLSLNIRPHELAIVDPAALKVSGVTPEIINAYPDRTTQFEALLALLNKYVDPYNPKDKFTLCGFKNSYFDDVFLRQWYTLQDDPHFGAHFWSNTIDVSVLATHYLLPERHLMPSFKLSRVAKYLGIEVKDENLHNSLYDVELTWQIYLRVRGKTSAELWGL